MREASKVPSPEKIDPAAAEIVATAFLQSIYQFLRLAETHESNNKIFDEAMVALIRTTQNLFLVPGCQGIEITFRGEHIFINKIRLRPRARQFHVYRFILKFMRFRRVGSLTIRDMPQSDKFKEFLWLLSRTQVSETLEQPALHVMEVLSSKSVLSFEVKPISKLHMGNRNGDGSDEGVADLEVVASYLHEQLRKFADVCFENLSGAKKFQLPELARLMGDLVQLSEEDIVQMLRLISIKRYDRPIPYRAANACFLMVAWATALRLPSGVITELATLALAHPLSLTDGKPIPLANAEQKQTVLSKIEDLKDVWPLNEVQTLALLEWTQSHGEGGVIEIGGVNCYQHFFSRMLRIVAEFERMTTFEPGQRVFLPDEALAEFFIQKGQFDPTLVKLFVNWMGVYPVGSLVLLQTGEVAQVFAGASDPTKFQRPLVMILKDSSGKILSRPSLCDLSDMNEKLGTYKKSIRKSLKLEETGLTSEQLKMTPVVS